MEPNNNQPINTSPFGQPVIPQPTAPQPILTPTPGTVPPTQPTQPVTNQGAPMTPKGNKKMAVLLVILVLLILGIAGYLVFAKNLLNNTQKTATENTSIVIPSVTITPTASPTTADQLEVTSPDADLNAIEMDVQGL